MIKPAELYRKMKRDKKQEGANEDMEEVPPQKNEHKFASTFKIPDVYSFDFKH